MKIQAGIKTNKQIRQERINRVQRREAMREASSLAAQLREERRERPMRLEGHYQEAPFDYVREWARSMSA